MAKKRGATGGWVNKRKRGWTIKLLLLGLFLGGILTYPGYLELMKYREQLKEGRQAVKTLETENQGLEREINALENDPEALERIGREKLKLFGDDEIIYMIEKEKEKEKSRDKSR